MGISLLIMLMNYETLLQMVQGTYVKPVLKQDDFLQSDLFSYFLPLYYFAMIAYVCEKVLGKKVIGGRLYVIKDLGLQIESFTLGGSLSKRFVDISRVRDIVINEVSFDKFIV